MLVEPEGQTILWRYIETENLLSMLATGSVFFGTPDAFEDAKEGKLFDLWPNIVSKMKPAVLSALRERYARIHGLPFPNREAASMFASDSTIQILGRCKNVTDAQRQTFSGKYRELILLKNLAVIDELVNFEYEFFMEPGMRESMQNMSSRVLISCWHESEHESSTMWRSYSGKGIALRTTAECLKEGIDSSFLLPADHFRYVTRRVHYLENPDDISNQIKERMVNPNRDGQHDFDFLINSEIYNEYFFKQIAYRDEREVRAIVFRMQPSVNRHQWSTPKGENIPFDLPGLIHEIVVSPYAPEWLTQVIASLLKKLGLTIPVRRSSLLMNQ